MQADAWSRHARVSAVHASAGTRLAERQWGCVLGLRRSLRHLSFQRQGVASAHFAGRGGQPAQLRGTGALREDHRKAHGPASHFRPGKASPSGSMSARWCPRTLYARIIRCRARWSRIRSVETPAPAPPSTARAAVMEITSPGLFLLNASAHDLCTLVGSSTQAWYMASA